MKIRAVVLTTVVVLTLLACQGEGDSVWFKGDFEAAKSAAAEADTLIMIDFYTDWCSWCRRLDQDTFPDPAVAAELAALVPMKVNAEDGGEELAEKFAVDGFPTIVFTNATGDEVDRIVGYLPPAAFVEQVQKIRTGDTFIACLSRLDENPADLDALKRSVDGLLERSDVSSAIARVEAFHRASPDANQAECRRLMFRARTSLHDRSYRKVAKLFRHGEFEGFEVPDTLGTSRLGGLLDGDFTELQAEDQARQLRQARTADAADVLAIVADDERDSGDLKLAANFAFHSGNYDAAVDLFTSWYDGADGAAANDLNQVAWRLYLMERELDLALEMVRKAYAEEETANIADTVARILYVSGNVDEAISLETTAAEEAGEKAAASFREAVEAMQGGEDLGDEPGFESFPGTRDS